MLAPMDWIWFSAYCFPARPMVTTQISTAVPITMPTAVRIKRILLVRNESMAMLTISLKSMVLRAVSAKGRPVIFHIVRSDRKRCAGNCARGHVHEGVWPVRAEQEVLPAVPVNFFQQ